MRSKDHHMTMFSRSFGAPGYLLENSCIYLAMLADVISEYIIIIFYKRPTLLIILHFDGCTVVHAVASYCSCQPLLISVLAADTTDAKISIRLKLAFTPIHI